MTGRLEDKAQHMVLRASAFPGEPCSSVAPGPGWYLVSTRVLESLEDADLVVFETLWKREFCMNCGAYWELCCKDAVCDQAVAK